MYVMVNSEELIGTTEHVTLYKRSRLNRCRYNRTRLYLKFDTFSNDLLEILGA
jgi:hypothetical protein